MANPACAFIAFVANRAWARLIVYLDEALIATVLWIIRAFREAGTSTSSNSKTPASAGACNSSAPIAALS
jgi:hypothetical protein